MADLTLTKADYLELLKEATVEEHFYLIHFQREVGFFWGIISALVGATAVGLFSRTSPEQYFALTLGPAMVGWSLTSCVRALRGPTRGSSRRSR